MIKNELLAQVEELVLPEVLKSQEQYQSLADECIDLMNRGLLRREDVISTLMASHPLRRRDN